MSRCNLVYWYFQVQFRILPHDFHVLHYNMYPTQPGNIKIPKLHISLPRYLSKSVDTMAQRMLPNSIFVTVSLILFLMLCVMRYIHF